MRAPRDLSASQFKAELARHGFKHEFWGWFVDTTGVAPTTKFGGVYRSDGTCLRRKTLARLIHQRAKTAADAAKQARAA